MDFPREGARQLHQRNTKPCQSDRVLMANTKRNPSSLSFTSTSVFIHAKECKMKVAEELCWRRRCRRRVELGSPGQFCCPGFNRKNLLDEFERFAIRRQTNLLLSTSDVSVLLANTGQS